MTEFVHNNPSIAAFFHYIVSTFQPHSASAAVAADADTGTTEGAMRGDLSAPSIEYDVFACDAFDEELGRWIRLMPDADFIPT